MLHEALEVPSESETALYVEKMAFCGPGLGWHMGQDPHCS